MATPQTPYDAVLHAARDVTKLDSALDAEMLGTALLAASTRSRRSTARPRSGSSSATSSPPPPAAAPPPPTTIRQRLRRPGAGGGGRGEVRPGAQAPAWSGQLGRVRLTGTCCLRRRVRRPDLLPGHLRLRRRAAGGPEHALVALVDHNIGIAKDVFVGGPAERILDQVREMCRR